MDLLPIFYFGLGQLENTDILSNAHLPHVYILYYYFIILLFNIRKSHLLLLPLISLEPFFKILGCYQALDNIQTSQNFNFHLKVWTLFLATNTVSCSP